MTSSKSHILVLPEVYRELSVAEMEYDGGFWKGITDFFGGVWDGLTSFAGDLWGGITGFAGGLWGGITGFAGGLWGGVTGLFGFGNDQFSHQRNGWGPESFYNSLDQFRAGVSRYLSSPMRYQ